jgi:hypothetical protein
MMMILIFVSVVDTKFLYVSDDALVVYKCLALRHDGTCFNGSEHVEFFHRTRDVSYDTILWMTRAVANACVDVTRIALEETSSGELVFIVRTCSF